MSPWAIPDADTYFEAALAQDPRGFQIDHLELALSFCRSFRTAVDGGAHIGTWAAYMAPRFKRVIALEPALDTFHCLERNVPHPNVQMYRVALGEKFGRGVVLDDLTRPGNTGSRYVSLIPDDGTRARNSVEFDVMPLDFFRLEDLDFLKLDVEGFELHALLGGERTIRACRPIICMEVKQLRPGVDPLAAEKQLEAWGYREVARKNRDRVYAG